MKRILFVVAALIALVGVGFAQEKPRTWTSSDGKTLEGTLEGVEGEMVQLRTSRGVFKLPKARLSEADQKYIANWEANAPIKVGEWPESIEVRGDFEVKDVSTEDAIIYETPHFRFHSPEKLTISVVRDFSRIFEATYRGVTELPVGFGKMVPEGELFTTKLYTNQAAYLSDGGMPNSGGQFSWRSRGKEYISGEIKVPLTSLGVERVGNRFKIDYDKDSGTLTHEIVHQVTVRWSVLGTPVWFSEGVAEYFQAAPYNRGTMRLTNMPGNVEKQVMKYARDSKFQMVGLDRLLPITRDGWAAALGSGDGGRNYNSACVLMTYFLHMDGEGDGGPVASYLKALQDGVDPAQALNDTLIRDRTPEQMEEAVGEAWKQNGMRIEFN